MKVFVYGTVMPGGRYYDYICKEHLASFTEAKAKGCLYDLKVGYPGMTLGEDWVKGYLLRFDSDEVLKKLDQLEGYSEQNSSENNEYNRIKIAVFDLNENFMGQAWSYIMNEAQLSQYNFERIESGQWENK